MSESEESLGPAPAPVLQIRETHETQDRNVKNYVLSHRLYGLKE